MKPRPDGKDEIIETLHNALVVAYQELERSGYACHYEDEDQFEIMTTLNAAIKKYEQYNEHKMYDREQTEA